MAYYPDLSPYEYLGGSVPLDVEAVNVGWLEPGHVFPTGEVSELFLDRLATLCARYVSALTRGWHACAFEHAAEIAYPYRTIQNGREMILGHGEVRVTAAGRWLAAPDLVLHYVRDHGYLPPPEFVEAVSALRAAPEEDA